MPWSESLPQFSLAGTLLTVLLLFFAAFGEPLLGRRAFAWLSRRENGDERALGLLYAVTMAIHVLWGLLILAVLLLSPELNLVDLGLRVPDAFGPIVGAAIGGTVALAAFWVLVNGLPTRGRKGHRGRRSAPKPMTLPEPGRRQYLLLPRTGRERALAAGMAVTGGVFGELLYRGLFITLVASMGVPLWIAAVLSVLLFSLAHAYQGWWGLLSAGFSGTLFTVLYLGTGSLVVPVLVHVALNLRSVVFPPASEREAAEEALRLDDDYYDDEYADDEYADDEYGRTGEFEAVGEESAPVGHAAVDSAQAGTPPHGSAAVDPYPQGPPPGQYQQGPEPYHQGPPPERFPRGPLPGQHPQGPPPGQYPQGPQPGQHPQGPPPERFPSGPQPGPYQQGPPPGQYPQGPYPQSPQPGYPAPQPQRPAPPQGFPGGPHPGPHPPQGFPGGPHPGPQPGRGHGGDTPGPHSPYRD